MIIVAWLVSECLSKRSEFADVGFVAWLVSEWLSKSSAFAGVGSAVEVGFLLSGLGSYENRFQKVLNLWVLVPLSRLAFIIGAWLVLEWISKKFEFAGVGSAVEVGFYYRGLTCIRMDL